MQLAIIQTGGKQYLVSPKDKIQVEKLEGKAGDTIKLDKVLMSSSDNSLSLGKPFVSGAAVEAKIVKQGRDKKVVVFKYKAKSRYRRKAGHRQNFTEIEITKI